jgi:hypothetical protein
MNPTETKTSVGMETVDETVNRAKVMLEPTVSASELTTPTTKVNPPAPTVNTNDGSRTNNLIQNTATNTQGFIQSESENAAKERELASLLGTQSVNGASERERMGKEFGLTDNLSRLTDIQTQLAQKNEKSALVKAEAVSGGAGAFQAERALTLEDRQNAIRTAGLAAEANVLQGNIETASTLINQAMSDYYSDRQINNQNLINQLNYYSGKVDSETQQLIDKEKRVYEEDQAKVKRVLDSVDDALASGAASVEDMRTLTNPRATDEDRLAVAQSVIAKGQAQMRDLEIQQAQASIRASSANAALNELEYGLTIKAAQQAEEDAANGVLTPEQAKTANDLNKDFEAQPIVKAYNEGLQRYIVLEDTLANGIEGIQDMQLVYDFMKAVDPTSVVREQEFENAAKTGTIFQGAYARFNGAIKTGGFLPESVKNDFIRAARSSFEAKNTQYYNVKNEYVKRVNNTAGVNNGADYLTAYEGAAPLTQTDFGIAESLSNATPDEMQDIMNRALQMGQSTTSR